MNTNTTQYSAWLKIMHWVMALGFFFMWGSGYYMTTIVETDTPLEDLFFGLHISTGVTLLFLLIFRVVIRNVTSLPEPVASFSKLERIGAHLGHLGLYLLPALVIFIGWAETDLGGHGVSWFGISMPKIFPTMEMFAGINLGDTTEALHKWLAYSMFSLAVVHIAAVVKHRWFDKHDILHRMTFRK